MQNRHILPLTGIRFVAALWIVLYHFPLWGSFFPLFQWLYPVTKLGYEAVPFFFLLSGFILSYNYFSEYSIAQHPKFVFLRFARLWPVHMVMLVLSAPLLSWPKDRVEELLMVRLWFNNAVSWNAPAWSISAEWFAYICVFPLAFLIFQRIRRAPVLILIVFLCLLAQSARVYARLFPDTNMCGMILFLFLGGSSLYRLRTVIKNPPAEAIAIGGAFFILAYVLANMYISDFFLYTGFAMIIFGVSYERGIMSRLLSKKIMVQGGLASYSLYMTHYLVIQSFIYYTWPYWKGLDHTIVARYALLLVVFMAFALMTLFSYRCIEVPANRKLRALWDRWEHRGKRDKKEAVVLPLGELKI